MKCGASLGEEDLISTVKQRRHRKLVLPAPASGGHLSYRIDLGETIECQIWAISSSSSLKCMQVAYMYSSANCSTIWRGRVKEVTARSMASCVCVCVSVQSYLSLVNTKSATQFLKLVVELLGSRSAGPFLCTPRRWVPSKWRAQNPANSGPFFSMFDVRISTVRKARIEITTDEKMKSDNRRKAQALM